MVLEINLIKGRTTTERFTLKDVTGAAVTIASTDVPRLKVYKGSGNTPDLELYTSATANNSLVTILTQSGATLGQVDCQFAQDDTDGLTVGVYDGELSLVDDSGTAPADPIIPVERLIIHVLPGAGGDVGKDGSG